MKLEKLSILKGQFSFRFMEMDKKNYKKRKKNKLATFRGNTTTKEKGIIGKAKGSISKLQ